MNKIHIIGGMHGDEHTGQKIVRHFLHSPHPGLIPVLANPAAMKKNKRFLETDLNRSFESVFPLSQEEHRALELADEMKDAECIIDFHNTKADDTNCAITTCMPNQLHLSLAAYFGFDKLVIMPRSGSLISLKSQWSISLEISQNAMPRFSVSDLITKLENLNIDMIPVQKGKMKIYQYRAHVKAATVQRAGIKEYRNFQLLSQPQSKSLGLATNRKYMPIFAHGEYPKDLAFILVEQII